jgi:signal peptidase II
MVACLVLAIDQLAKHGAGAVWRDFPKSVVPGFLSFGYAENTGAAWSTFSGGSRWLAALGVSAMVVAVIFRKIFNSFQKKFAAALIFAGICGNTVDRIIRGCVIDFIAVDLKFYRWPMFNVADCAIFVGIGILLFTFHKKAQEAG